MNIKNILNGLIENSTVKIKGWVRNKRGSKQTSFISINDGSTINSLQVVAEEIVITEETIKNITIGSSICVEGKIVKSIGSEQSFEVLAKRLAKRYGRPLLQTHDPEQTLKALIKKRYPVYNHADLLVNAEDDGVDITVSKVVECLSDYYCYSKKLILPEKLTSALEY